MRFFAPLLANIALTISALGFGSLPSRLLPQSSSKIDRACISLLGGAGILGTLLFCIGQVWFSRTAMASVLLAGFVLGTRSVTAMFRDARPFFAGLPFGALPVVIVAIVLAATVVGGFAEPTGDMNSDAIAYHYLGPKVWVREGIIRPVPDEVLTAFPAVVETQFAALTAFGGDRAPQLFSAVALAALLLAAASLSIRLGLKTRAVWWVAALIATMPAIYRGCYEGFIDVLFAGFILTAARLAFDAETIRDYALFGIFCGIALGTKYTALISWALLLVCCYLFAMFRSSQTTRTLLRNLAISGAIAIAMAAPFYLRNWLLLGCPIFPPPHALLRLFPETKILPAVLAEVQKNVAETGTGLGRGLRHFLLLPFNLTYHTADFRGAGGIGLTPLAFAPLGLIARRRDRCVQGLALFALLQLAAWFVTAQVSRYAIPLYALGAIFAVLGWEYVARRGSSFARALAALVVSVSLAYGLYMILGDRVVDMHAALSAKFEEARRHREIPDLDSFDYLNSDPSVSKVLILGPHVPAFYSDKEYIKPLGRWGEQTLPDATNIQAVLSSCRALRVTHVLDVFPEYGPLHLPQNTAGLTLVFERGSQKVFRVD